jgi:hypothetical protein
MFDPFFPLMLICAPVPFLMLIVYELHRKDSSPIPRGPSIGLAMVSTGGLWLLLIFVRFKDGMSKDAFDQLQTRTLLLATASIIACYCLLALYRAWGRKQR